MAIFPCSKYFKKEYFSSFRIFVLSKAEDRRSNGSNRCYLPLAQTALPARGGSTQQDKGGAAMHAGAIQIKIR